MSSEVTLIARTTPLPLEIDITTRGLSSEDIPALGELYYNAYDQGISEQSVQAAVAAIESAFSGKHGKLLTEISQVVVNADGRIIAAVLVIENAADVEPDANLKSPSAPLLLELFTDRDHRRQGLAERLVLLSADLLFHAGYPEVAVRVQESNSAALALYLSLDFRRWEREEEQED